MTSKVTREAIAKIIRENREKKGLSQGDLAHCVSVDRQVIHRIEKADQNIYFELMVQIAMVLEFKLDELIEAVPRVTPPEDIKIQNAKGKIKQLESYVEHLKTERAKKLGHL